MDQDSAARNEILARLAQSRQELRSVLDPPRGQSDGNGATSSHGHSEFPRSRTMQMLLSSRGLGTVGALVGGLLIARPAMALRILRLLPASAIGKMLLARAVTAMRAKPRSED
jgi:hypothetical protein